jgi:hypothetical protein
MKPTHKIKQTHVRRSLVIRFKIRSANRIIRARARQLKSKQIK